MKLFTRRTFIVAALLTALVAGVLYRSGGQPQAGTRLVVGGPNDLAMLVVLAQDRGLFERHGLEVDYRHLQTGKITQDALMSGDLDVGVIVDTNIAFIGFQPDAKTKVLASIQEQNGDGIVARADRGIKTPSDLRGKTVGYTPGTTSHVFLDRMLRLNGLKFEDVKPLAMPPPALEAAIVRGDIDAASIWQPFRFNAMRQLASRGVEFTDRKAYTAYALLAARSEVVSERRDALERLLKALLEAESQLSAETASSIPILAGKVGISVDAMQALWPEYRIRVSLDHVVKQTIVEEGEWIRSSQEGFVGKPQPDYAKFFETGPLRSIRPDRVNFAQ